MSYAQQPRAGLSKISPRSVRSDGEFRITSRHWTGGLRLEFGAQAALMVQGTSPLGTRQGRHGVLTLSGASEVWDLLLAAKPPRFHTDISTLIVTGRLMLDGDRVLYAQYYPAVMRAIELLRPPASGAASACAAIDCSVRQPDRALCPP